MRNLPAIHLMRGGELEGKGFDEAACGRLIEGNRLRGQRLPCPLGELGGQLQDEHLLEGEPLTGALERLRRVWKMHLPHGRRARKKATPCQQFRWEELFELVGVLEKRLDLRSH